MSFTVIIPARYESTRLPGKPLVDIAGKPMIQHVVERAQQSEASAVYVATDDERIEAACQSFGANVCMTSAEHLSGTDRIEEVITSLALDDNQIVVNVQGDEPLIPPAVINQVAANIASTPAAGICTLYETINDYDEIQNPNVVKLLTDKDGMALSFSRAVIPFPRGGIEAAEKELYKRHIGIYAYRVKVLHEFVNWPVAAIENTEKLEQLRAMFNGVKIHADQACAAIPAGVDSQSDLSQVRAILEGLSQ
ncbi:3-deoxy-manno-octulosonate cytidylyltransferase [Gammaproteobacteria bacterium]|nr:3-deoxy-manno-octulosonate cytidylyltransferase [Gammaproteobacteria bacterium]